MSRPILDKLGQLVQVAPAPDPSDREGAMDSALPEKERAVPLMKPTLGNLEPPEDILNLLSSDLAVRDALNIELGDQDPISCLFDHQFAAYKAPPPLSPIAKPNEQKASKKKKKRDRKAEYERSKAKKAEAGAEAARLASQTPAAEGGDETAPSEPVSPTTLESRPKKRPSMSGGPLPGAPRVVDDVDNRGSFQLFNAGWILPADHRRGGRAPPPDKPVLPPPRKRQKTEHASRLSIVSTAASENQTLETPAPEEHEPVVAKEERGDDDAMMQVDSRSVPPSPQRPTVAHAPPGTPLGGEVRSRTATDAAGRVVIEELDTPEIRRQKKAMRRLERERLKMQAESELGSVVPDTPSVAATIPPDSAPPTPETSGFTRMTSPGHAPRETPSKKPDSSASKGKKPTSKGKQPPTPGSGKGKQPAVAAPSTTTAPTTTDDDSDLSELSDLPSEDGNGEDEDEDETEDDPDIPPNQKQDELQPRITPANRVQRRVAPANQVQRRPPPASNALTAGPPNISSSAKGKRGGGPPARRKQTEYEGGTLVWAKAESYPWWPAVVFDSDHPEVPASIVQAWKEMRYRRKIKLWIVRFYDRTSSWQYLPRDKLQLLGEDEALDADMLAPQSVHQKWKSPSARQSCRDAFRTACAEMETKSVNGTPGADQDEETTGNMED